MEPWHHPITEFFATPDTRYVALVFLLFILPRLFIRFGIPFALTAFMAGTVSSLFDLSIVADPYILVLSTLGIISLFLFAGLEVNTKELVKNKTFLLQHLFIRVSIISLSAYGIHRLFQMGVREAMIYSLALLTPSTGFILDNLEINKHSDLEKRWITSLAISTEVIALVLLFVVLRSESFSVLLPSALGILGLIYVLPKAFKFFANFINPLAPKSEFGFIIMLALIAGIITKKLGAYYLIGAFIVGVVAKKFEESIPSIASSNTMKSLKAFSGFFIPIYFFHAGSKVELSTVSLISIAVGLLLALIFLPIRAAVTVLHRKIALKETALESIPISLSILPTLVFGLVLTEILRTEFQLNPTYANALIIYTIIATTAPQFLLNKINKTKSALSDQMLKTERDLGEPKLP